MRTCQFPTAVCVVLFSLVAANLGAAAIIYGGLGGQNGISTNNGSLVTINPTNGAVTVIGTPVPEHSISGLTFTANGDLWGSTQNGGGNPPSGTVPPPVTTSDLIQINPVTGAEISSVLINANGTPVSIADLATQPGTDTDFWDSKPKRRELYRYGEPLHHLDGGRGDACRKHGRLFRLHRLRAERDALYDVCRSAYYRWQLCRRRRYQLHAEHPEPGYRSHTHVSDDSRFLFCIRH